MEIRKTKLLLCAYAQDCLCNKMFFQVGLFPDVIERKVARHFEKGDHV